MRWIFITLAALNVLLLGYFLLASEDETAAASPVVEAVSPDKRLILLSEVDDVTLQSTVAQTSVLSTECYKLGPFDSEKWFSQVEGRVAALDLEHDQIIETVASDKPVEFWVHVPARKSRVEAEKVLAELKRRRVDSFLIGKGDLENSISLGLFRVKGSADRIANQVRGYGIPVVVEVKNEDAARRWIEIRDTPALTESVRAQIKGNYRNASWQHQTCQVL